MWAPVPSQQVQMILYTRVSSDKRERRSCQDQELELRDDVESYVARTGEHLVISDVLSDPNVSASRWNPKDRPDWIELMRRLRADEVRVVGFWEMSRSTRNLREWVDFAEVAEDKGVHVFLRGRIYDCGNPHDLAYLTNQVTRGIEEVGETRERLMRTKRRDAERGRPGAGPVFGLMSIYHERTGALITHAPDLRPWPEPHGRWTPAGLIRDASRRILGGESRRSVCLDWNDLGVPSKRGKLWHPTVLTGILSTTSIIGKRTYKGALINEGGWEGLIEESEFNELQRIFGRASSGGRNRDRSADLKHFCSSLAKCGVCGTYVKHGTSGKQYSYRCQSAVLRRAGCVSRASHVLEAHVESLVVVELSRPDVLLRFEKPVDPAQIARDEERAQDLRQQMDLAFKESLKPGVGRLPVTQLMAIQSSLQEEVKEIESRIAEAKQGAPMRVRQLAGLGPAQVLERWRSFTPEQKRSLVFDVTDSVHVLPVGKVGRRKLLPSESVDIRFVGDPPFELLGG